MVRAAVLGLCGRGPQRDRLWSEAYEAGAPSEPVVEIDYDPGVHAALGTSFTEWIHHPDLWRSIASCPVPVQLVAAADDVRPSWPLAQLAALLPRGRLTTVPDVPHDFWSTHPDTWTATVGAALRDLAEC